MPTSRVLACVAVIAFDAERARAARHHEPLNMRAVGAMVFVGVRWSSAE